jgi:hypothetical protein
LVRLGEVAQRTKELKVHQIIASALGNREHVINVWLVAQLLNNIFAARGAFPAVPRKKYFLDPSRPSFAIAE